jgi:hypothetical protein
MSGRFGRAPHTRLVFAAPKADDDSCTHGGDCQGMRGFADFANKNAGARPALCRGDRGLDGQGGHPAHPLKGAYGKRLSGKDEGRVVGALDAHNKKPAPSMVEGTGRVE